MHSLQETFTQASIPRKLGVGAGILSVSVLLIWQGTIHPVTASTSQEDIQIATSTSTVSVITVTATKAPIQTKPAAGSATRSPATLTATPSIVLPRVTLIGDSIMQGAAPMIEDVLGTNIYIDAARKRKMEDVPALIETLYKKGHLSRVVVIHLGSNRPFEDDVFDDAMKTLLSHHVERVIFINVHRHIGWEYYINQKIAKDVARWSQAELIDWNALSQHEQGWFIKDQTHLSYYGSKAYVNAIQQKLEATP
jgi:hypothetical protein